MFACGDIQCSLLDDSDYPGKIFKENFFEFLSSTGTAA